MNDLILREVHLMTEFEALVELQQAIWGMSPEAAASPYVMMATSHNGGGVIGAELKGRLIGFCYGFAAWRGGSPFLWSHMAGVLPEYRGQGVGFQLKHAQRKWAIQQGYSVMSWTFDPLQNGNANFNFRHLGVVCDTYHVNHYGEMTDAINAGLASDRLEVQWHLNDDRVVASAESGLLEGITSNYDSQAFALRAEEDNEPLRSSDAAFEYPLCFVETPFQIGALKQNDIEKARRWQLAVRWALQKALQHGFLMVDFASEGGRGWYVLKRN